MSLHNMYNIMMEAGGCDEPILGRILYDDDDNIM